MATSTRSGSPFWPNLVCAIFALISYGEASHISASDLSGLLRISGGSSSTSAPPATMSSKSPPWHNSSDRDDSSLLIVFSDLDGTLIHYSDSLPEHDLEPTGPPAILRLPPSATGMVGVVSSDTLVRCRDIRDRGVKLVLVSGMRTSTLMKRLPYLPKADAYCCEAGGRIFYPTAPGGGPHRVVPVPFRDASDRDLEPFSLTEDMEWRRRMEQPEAAGATGYAGEDSSSDRVVPVANRNGALWSFARTLMDQGLVLDMQGYCTCFRVNRKQQTTAEASILFERLLDQKITLPSGLASSVNLGCVDVYPSISGKKQCCRYLAHKFDASSTHEPLASRCVCICDDDNDIDMAMACAHAYIPSVSSDSLAALVRSDPTRFTPTFRPGREGVRASEEALALILERIAAAKS